MKIGFVGNTNNYPFLLAENLKNKCEILFLVDAAKNDILNRPEYYAGNLISYPYPANFIEKPKIRKKINKYFPFLFSRDIIRLLNTCDAVITNEAGHYITPFLKKSIIIISVFSGSDLDVNCNWTVKNKIIRSIKNPFRKLLTFLAFHWGQLILEKNIRRSKLISYFPVGLYPETDALIRKIRKNIPYTRFEHMHLALNGLEYCPPPENPVLKIFNTARFNWKKPYLPSFTRTDIKRNDIIIRGIANFINQTGTPLDIHFIEKGNDVDATKDLVKELKIDTFITWHKNLSHHDFIEMLKNCDIVTDHMNEHVIGGGAYGMALGRPMISNAIPKITKRITGVDTEICHAENEEDVYRWLEKLVFNKEFRIQKGIQSRAYIDKYYNLNIESDFFYEFILKELQLDT